MNISRVLGATLLFEALSLASGIPAHAQIYDPPILKAECRIVVPDGCVCLTVFEEPLPIAQFAFLVGMLVEEGIWLTKEQRWFDEDAAERLLSHRRADCRVIPQTGPGSESFELYVASPRAGQ